MELETHYVLETDTWYSWAESESFGALKYFLDCLRIIPRIQYGEDKTLLYQFNIKSSRCRFVESWYNVSFRMIFDIVNMLQGAWIFILFVWFNPEAKRRIRRERSSSNGGTSTVNEVVQMVECNGVHMDWFNRSKTYEQSIRGVTYTNKIKL